MFRARSRKQPTHHAKRESHRWRRARTNNVRSSAGLSQSVSRQFLTFRLRHEVLLLLLFSSPGVKRKRIQARVNRHCDAQKSVDCFELFANQAERNVIEARSTVLV